LSKITNFNVPHLYLALPLGVITLEFRKDIWHQKLRLSCGVVSVILCSAILVQYRLVTDRRTDDDSRIYRATVTSRGESSYFFCLHDLYLSPSWGWSYWNLA